MAAMNIKSLCQSLLAASFAQKVIGKRGWLAVRNINYSYTGSRYRRRTASSCQRAGVRSVRGDNRSGNQTQIVRMGGIAPDTESLATPRRRPLPRHPAFQRRDIRASVLRCDRKRHVDVPVIDWRKRRLFGINNAGGARLKLTACALCVRGCRGQCRAGQRDCGGKCRFRGHSHRISVCGSAAVCLKRDCVQCTPKSSYRSLTRN